jgi:hypothetical protein
MLQAHDFLLKMFLSFQGCAQARMVKEQVFWQVLSAFNARPSFGSSSMHIDLFTDQALILFLLLKGFDFCKLLLTAQPLSTILFLLLEGFDFCKLLLILAAYGEKHKQGIVIKDDQETSIARRSNAQCPFQTIGGSSFLQQSKPMQL